MAAFDVTPRKNLIVSGKLAIAHDQIVLAVRSQKKGADGSDSAALEQVLILSAAL
jgi:hypothetical protein